MACKACERRRQKLKRIMVKRKQAVKAGMKQVLRQRSGSK